MNTRNAIDAPMAIDNTSEQAQLDFGKHITARLLGATITGFGSTEDEDIYLSVVKDGDTTEVVFSLDEQGKVALFEVMGGA